MSASVDQFIQEQQEVFKKNKGFKKLVVDLNLKYGRSGSAEVINDTAAKLILSHHYDTSTDQPLAKAFKLFVLNRLQMEVSIAS